MSQKYQEDAIGEADEEQMEAAAPQRIRQSNGTNGEPPVRRSWRPCQMQNPDGEMAPHNHHRHYHHAAHHHHHPQGRGPPRHRRRPPSGQGQSPGQAVSPGGAPTRSPEEIETQDHEPRPVQQHRPAVTRYRRHGDPNPRLRNHRQRQQFREMQDGRPGIGPVEIREQEASLGDPALNQSQERGSPHQTPLPVVSSAHISTSLPMEDVQIESQHTPAEAEEDHHEFKAEDEKESKEVIDKREQEEDDGNLQLSAGNPTCTHSERAEEEIERVEEDREDVMENAEEDPTAQGSEITDLCSDTESAASLSMDGPLHSPPPLQSPTPPSSPDVPPFPQLDHFSEDITMSSLPDNNALPEEEDCSESCSLSHSTSCSELHPKTYAEFYTESHKKTYEPTFELYSEAKCHPDSFPEPLKTSYPELQREACRQSGRRPESNKAQQESPQEPFVGHRTKNAQKGAPSSPTESSHQISRQSRDRGSRSFPADSSVGCRLHHYDGQSDSEGDSADKSPLPKTGRPASRQPQTQTKTQSAGLGEAQNERNMPGLQGEGTKCSGDAISLAIKDIKEAIEGVKTKTVRSPYTPDQPVEPIWVMRQEISPTEDAYPMPTSAGHTSPHSPSQSALESPSRYTSVPVRDSVSPLRAETSRNLQHGPTQQPHHNHHGYQSQSRPPQMYTPTTPTQSQPSQRLTHPQSPEQPSAQAQPSSPLQKASIQEIRRALPPFPTFVDVPGPCDPEDLIDGIIFAATYLGCTHLLSERTPTKSARMQQAQEAMSRVRAAQKQAKNRKKSPDSETPSTAEVDLFMSTQRIKVLNADTQEALMDLPLRTISYIADIGNMVVLMARGKMVRSRSAQENLDHASEQSSMNHDDRRMYRMICHVFESEDAQLIAQSIGQSFSVAYQEFLRANGIDPEDLSQREYSDLLNTQDMYNDDLIHFSKSENCRDVYIEKQKGEILGVVIVESGWGSILPTVIIASLMHGGPAEKSGRLNIGDQIMTVNGTSLVGLPLSTCQSIIKGLKSQSRIKMNIVRCPPVTMVLIRRPDLRYQLGFSVQNGIICSLMRGGIAERGGVRVGHRIIEINGQSVVATPHEKIVQILSNAMGEIHMKTMPAAMYRLLTAQEQPVYI
ncbi:amyloid-beta A4 precursor protein-binding family A member 1 [Cyprinodon tularosa]|uniref:amyloid-beta A4 precursor protein-binding family A member 1 n=1 Tax=Cyprinodon tularosa TaxID=77115 RepID=UPI0018E23971|nr:amyloid-beta A4 precursor protein-binding family A member 1 [Cyprinodon tularosa]